MKKWVLGVILGVAASTPSFATNNNKLEDLTPLEEASQNTFREAVRTRNVPVPDKWETNENKNERSEELESRNKREEKHTANRNALEQKYTNGELTLLQYNQDDEQEIRRFEQECRECQLQQEQKSPSAFYIVLVPVNTTGCETAALQSKMIVMMSASLKEYIEVMQNKKLNENPLDLHAKNKKSNPAFSFLNLKINQVEKSEKYGDLNSYTNTYKFKNWSANKTTGRTSFDFEAEVYGTYYFCHLESSWRLYGKETNAYLFDNGSKTPQDIMYLALPKKTNNT